MRIKNIFLATSWSHIPRCTTGFGCWQSNGNPYKWQLEPAIICDLYDIWRISQPRRTVHIIICDLHARASVYSITATLTDENTLYLWYIMVFAVCVLVMRLHIFCIYVRGRGIWFRRHINYARASRAQVW